MKKISILLAAVLTLSLLCGCMAVDSAEDLIASIGIVTLSSRNAIETAEKNVANLTEEQRQQVGNLPILEQARARLDELQGLVDTAQASIDAIGKITPDSGETIAAARAAYDALAAEGLENEISNYGSLENAEYHYGNYCAALEEFRSAVDAVGQVTADSRAALDEANEKLEVLKELDIEDYAAEDTARLEALEQDYAVQMAQQFYDEAMAAYGIGDLETGNTARAKLKDTCPDTEQAAAIDGDAAALLIPLAQQAFGNDELELTDNILRTVWQTLAADTAAIEGYTELVDAFSARMTAIRPATGVALYNKVGSGYSQLHISADEHDSLIKLESIADPDVYMLLYVRAHETADVPVADGTYLIKYTSGESWYGEEAMFGSKASFTKADDIFEFTVTYSGGYVYYSDVSVTLYTVVGGNLSTTPIGANDF